MKAKQIEMDDKEFEDKLTELYGDVEICGNSYSAGYALREIDPVAFRCAMADEPEVWECSECGEQFDNEDDANECCAPDEDEETAAESTDLKDGE